MAELNFGLLNNDFTGQQEKAFNYAAQISALAAQRNAGRAYAQGDYTGASQALARNGDIAQGQKVAEYGAQRQAGTSYANGDYGGAASALAQGGDIQGAQAIEQKQAALQQAQIERTAKGQQYIAQALPVLKQVAAAHAADPDGGTAARAAAFDHIAAEAQQLTGASPQQLAAFKDSWVSDPQGTLTRLEAQIPTEFKTAGDSLFAFKNGQQVGQYEGTKTVTAGPGQTVLQYGGSGGPIQPQGAGGAPVAPDAASGPQAANGPTEAQVQDYIAKNIPGAIITSGQRTPEHNAAVGGVPNSMHIPGQAVDFVMPKGMTFDQVKAMVAQTGLQPTELLNEGSHVHLAWGPKPGEAQAQPAGGARVLYKGGPTFRNPTPAELAAHPTLSQVNTATGEMHYEPVSAQPSLVNDKGLDQLAAVAIRNGGKIPPGYARDRATVAAVTNRIAALKPDGMSEDDFARVMQNNLLALDARKSAGNAAAKSQVGTSINEGTVNNSINILRGLIPVAASKGNFTQVNDLQQFIRRSSNDKNAVNFANAINSISSEYARVLTGATGGSGSSDSARHEAADRILKGYNGGTLDAVLNQMQAEMRGRSESYKIALQQLTGGGYGGIDTPFSGEGGQNAPPPAQGGPKVIDFNSLPKRK